ncbi:MAG: molybdopterin molybdotransferase MoeA [Bryobacterales bacterium]|nr:molybdopterin molybdotransferase MoeA [Bryobacterales bacterium]
MVTPDEAWDIVLQHVRPQEPVVVPLIDALGCCLAEDVRADRDLPPADRSAMDGYAVRHSDLRRPSCVLRLIGEVAAGSPARPRVRPGTCALVLTGANVPPGADTVVMAEQARPGYGVVEIHSSIAAGSNILRRGEDARKGAVLLAAGTRLGAAEIGVCAAVGRTAVRVHRRPRVTLLCTGAELRAAGSRVRPHEIRNSNGPALCAALAQWGYPGTRFATVTDQRPKLLAALRRALRRYDVVLLSGGVSVGKYDLVPAAVADAGAVTRFHGVRMKPGKPTLYATATGGRHIFGLPGNPLSSLTALHEFVLPALRRLSGQPIDSCRIAWPMALAAPAEPGGGRVHHMLARLVSEESGLSVAPVISQSSADLASAAGADGVVLVPVSRRSPGAGETVLFRPWRPLP